MKNDTIVAISTPPGVGGIAVLRISGSEAVALALRHISQSAAVMQPRKAFYALFRLRHEVLDEVVVTFFQGPHSYTGEDVLEISCHGSSYIQQRMLQALIDDGARLADPGEFTLRAFLNGRMNLSQAEAVGDLIQSTSQASHQLAIRQMRGDFTQLIEQLRSRFVEVASLLELELDFSEEDVEFANRTELLQLLDQIEHEVTSLRDTFRLGNAIREGVPVAIIGRPNVGKSTLLNALVGDERAIVSDIPGTTRDTVEDSVTIQGIRFRFIDTAGIRQSSDEIELEGVQRSFRAAKQAQVVLYMIDAGQAVEQMRADFEEFSTHVSLEDKRVVLLYNKVDIHEQSGQVEGLPGNVFQLSISARDGVGLDALRQHLADAYSIPENQVILTNLRHYEAMGHILESLAQIRQGLVQRLPADLVVVDIREALYHLGLITGQVTNDDILGSIFSNFCIGK